MMRCLLSAEVAPSHQEGATHPTHSTFGVSP